MKRTKLLAAVCAFALCCSVALAGCSSQSYTPTPKDQTISNSALISSGTLKVGVNAQAAPLAGQTSSSSEIVGIDVDVAAAIADQLGLKLEVVDVGSDAEGALSSKRADIVLGIDSSSTDTSYWRSSAYLQTGVALFAPSSKTSIPAAGSSPSIAAQTSSKALLARDQLVRRQIAQRAKRFEVCFRGYDERQGRLRCRRCDYRHLRGALRQL